MRSKGRFGDRGWSCEAASSKRLKLLFDISKLRTLPRGALRAAASFVLDFTAPLRIGLNHADHGEVGEARLSGVAPVGEQPIDIVTDDMMALFDAAVIGVGGVGGVEDLATLGRRIAKKVSTSA